MTAVACHLTEDELDEVLMGLAGPELQAHCAACAVCRIRIAPVSESIEGYNQASLAWSEARSNTFTRDLSGHRTTWCLSASAARSMAATLLLGVVASLTAGTYVFPAHPVDAGRDAISHPVLRGFAPDARLQQIARDNAMLQAIDAELTEPASAPAELFRGSSAAVDPLAVQPASVQDRD